MDYSLIDSKLVISILKRLEQLLQQNNKEKLHLLIGGASALVGVYNFTEATTDIDAIFLNSNSNAIKPEIETLAKEFHLPNDWINPHFGTFTIYLPPDYKKRCVPMYSGSKLCADALGVEDLLIMKFMAGREKDLFHIQFLLKLKPNLKIIETRLEELTKAHPKIANKALDLFDSLVGDK